MVAGADAPLLGPEGLSLGKSLGCIRILSCIKMHTQFGVSSRAAEEDFNLVTCGEPGGCAPSPAEMSEGVATSSSIASLDDVITPDVNVLVFSHRVESPGSGSPTT